MDPSRKRAIRLTVALTAALLLASALIYTSFTAGHQEVTASQLLARAKPGKTYMLAGTVLDGSVRREGTTLLFRDPRPEAEGVGAGALLRDRPRPVRARAGGDGHRRGPRRVGVRRPGELADDQVPVEVPSGGRVVAMVGARL